MGKEEEGEGKKVAHNSSHEILSLLLLFFSGRKSVYKAALRARPAEGEEEEEEMEPRMDIRDNNSNINNRRYLGWQGGQAFLLLLKQQIVQGKYGKAPVCLFGTST